MKQILALNLSVKKWNRCIPNNIDFAEFFSSMNSYAGFWSLLLTPAVILCVAAPGVRALHRPSGLLWLLQKHLLHFHQ